MASSVSIKSAKNGPNASQSFAFPARLSPILKVEGQSKFNSRHEVSFSLSLSRSRFFSMFVYMWPLDVAMRKENE